MKNFQINHYADDNYDDCDLQFVCKYRTYLIDMQR